MDYMASHGLKRARPIELVPGTQSIITVLVDYRPAASDANENLANPRRAYISRYALGRDYHKLIRNRLQTLAERIETATCTPCIYRAFVDSAPVMEVELAVQSGQGWRGKNTLLLTRHGSWHFLGELFLSLALPPDQPPEPEHCGSCTACLDACPTAAIVAPYRLDARRCISYLTIEHSGAIPVELRSLMGNRIYGCDDCQLVCPWNRFSADTREADFQPRHNLDKATLLELFAWTEDEFLDRFQGSAIRRIGFERWQRNLAVALGNAPADSAIVGVLLGARNHPSLLVREHVEWALARHVTDHEHAT